MFYQPGLTPHSLPSDPFKACVVPRPIGWISTISSHLISPSDHQPVANLAPYSQFNNLTFSPPYVMFSANQTPQGESKDSVVNARETGVFCWNLATWDLRQEVNITAEQVEYGVDEFERAGLEKCWSKVLRPKLRANEARIDGDGKDTGGRNGGVEMEFKGVPMVERSPVRFECTYHDTIHLPGDPPMGSVDVVIGKVVGIHIDDGVIDEKGRLDLTRTKPIARCGYNQYVVIGREEDVFTMDIPGSGRSADMVRAGLGGEQNVKQGKDEQ